MRNKTRKHIWPVSLVMSIAIIGALAAFLVLANNPGATMAHGGVTDHAAACAAMTDEQQKLHTMPRQSSKARKYAAAPPRTTPTAAAMKQLHRRWSAAAVPAAPVSSLP